MSCSFCSDLGGTNIWSHGWTKSSLRATANEYQIHWEPSKRLRSVGSDTRQRPTFLEREGLIWPAPINKQFLSRLSQWPEIQQSNSEILVESHQESSIKSFNIQNYTKHEKQHETRKTTRNTKNNTKHENLVSKKDDLFIDSKQTSPQEIENYRSTISFQTGIPRITTKLERRNCNVLQFIFRSDERHLRS